MDDLRISLEQNPAAEDVAAVRAGLAAANVARVPTLPDLLDHHFSVIVQRDGKPMGGALSRIDWGWLFVDTLWFDEALRGQGWGSRVLAAAESVAALYGIDRSYLFTTSFQALDFYLKQGYTRIGTIADRPPGHTFYVLAKMHLELKPIDPRLLLEFPTRPETYAIVDGGLLAFNNAITPPKSGAFAVFLRDAAGTIRGGATAVTFWDWCDLMFMWIDEPLRGQGWGKRLLDALDEECRRRACQGIMTATNEFQALPFYQQHGFEIVAPLPDCPPGYTHYFLQKQFRSS